MGYDTGNSVPMTKEEMDQYLTSIGGIYRTWGRDRGPITNAHLFEIKGGWYPMVKSLIDELIALGWDRTIHQVKEKFGGLRFYAENIPEGGEAIIAKYEELSYSICENCGKQGVTRQGSWLRVLCDEHSEGKEPFEWPKIEQ